MCNERDMYCEVKIIMPHQLMVVYLSFAKTITFRVETTRPPTVLRRHLCF